MSCGFCGQFLHTIDDKNRFKVPASMREGLGLKVYIIKSPDPDTRCIYLYSEDGWQEVYEQFNKGNVHNAATRRMARKILSKVMYAEVDKGGRITLNATVKEFLGVENEVYVIGVNKHIELWLPEEWDKEEEIFEDESADELNIQF